MGNGKCLVHLLRSQLSILNMILKWFCMALTVITLNGNRLHNSGKWSDFWRETPKSEIICVQETHLTPDQEYSFKINAQSYDFIFSHETSNSAGVFTVIHRNTGVMVVKSGEIPGRLLSINLSLDNVTTHIINIYAPNNAAQ